MTKATQWRGQCSAGTPRSRPPPLPADGHGSYSTPRVYYTVAASHSAPFDPAQTPRVEPATAEELGMLWGMWSTHCEAPLPPVPHRAHLRSRRLYCWAVSRARPPSMSTRRAPRWCTAPRGTPVSGGRPCTGARACTVGGSGVVVAVGRRRSVAPLAASGLCSSPRARVVLACSARRARFPRGRRSARAGELRC